LGLKKNVINKRTTGQDEQADADYFTTVFALIKKGGFSQNPPSVFASHLPLQ
jgi:hypothetical protein